MMKKLKGIFSGGMSRDDFDNKNANQRRRIKERQAVKNGHTTLSPNQERQEKWKAKVLNQEKDS
jgi:hypothetical protein